MATITVNKGPDYDVGAYNLRTNINKLNTYKNITIKDESNVGVVASLDSLFENMVNVVNINIQMNTSTVSGCWCMCYNCTNLKSISNFNTSNVTSVSGMFSNCVKLVSVPNFDFRKATDFDCFRGCRNLRDLPQFNLPNLYSNGLIQAFANCNNLSNASVQNIINICLNMTNVSSGYMNLNTFNWNSPFCYTNIVNTRYQNRWAELNAKGWTY